jgi:hypothetical protein
MRPEVVAYETKNCLPHIHLRVKNHRAEQHTERCQAGTDAM